MDILYKCSGFNKYEVGPILNNEVRLELEDIGRIAHVRDLPVEKVLHIGHQWSTVKPKQYGSGLNHVFLVETNVSAPFHR